MSKCAQDFWNTRYIGILQRTFWNAAELVGGLQHLSHEERFGGENLFNRGALLNVGFRESLMLDNFSCYVFHDVDMLPEDYRLPYRCGHEPIHLSPLLQRSNYRVMYETYVGGVLALSKKQFSDIRGFSNSYEGWGGDDDDMYIRIRRMGYTVKRNPYDISRFTTIQHLRDRTNPENPKSSQLLKNAADRVPNDGYPETCYVVKSKGTHSSGFVFWITVELCNGTTRKDHLVQSSILLT